MADERYLHVDAGRVRFDIERLMEAYPELSDDDDLRADMIEGETAIEAVVTRIYKSLRADEAQAEGAKTFKDDLAARQKRYENRAARKRQMILDMMDAGDVDKLPLPIATFTRRDPQPVVVVDDVSDLPQGFTRTKIEADKIELKKALMAGETIPGAHIELGAPSIQIRVA